ncbi:MAG: ATP-binding protein [Chloroflexota bacterium]
MTKPIKDAANKLKKNTTRKNTPKGSSPASSNLKPGAGDPNCPHCQGLGYIRADLSLDHPEFGKLQVCACRSEELSQRTSSRLYAFSQLEELKNLTFDNFKPRGHVGLGEAQADSLEFAYNQAVRFSQEKTTPWIFLHGKYGCGKTHLAAAIANISVEKGTQTLFITVPDLLDTLRFSYSSAETSFEERFEEIRRSPLLILDDFGTQNATDWAQEKLFQIINFRYINKLPMVVTTNLDLDEIEGRIRSRLEDPELVTRVNIIAPDYRRPSVGASFHELSTLSLHGNQTFKSFDYRKDEGLPTDVIKNLDKVSKAASKFAKKPAGWFVLTGTYGSGKTHLASAIANYQAELGAPPLFIVLPDLLDHLRATFNPSSSSSYDRRFNEIRATPLLILDDLGTQATTPWVKEKLYQLFNYRYNAELPTVITTSNDLEEMDARIRSRMLDTRICSIYAIKAPTYTGRK